MKPEDKSVSENIEKELKKMKKKLDSENLALHKILKSSSSYRQDEMSAKNMKKKNNSSQL
jgi:hypothetical protein